jgi:hypothetical protein
MNVAKEISQNILKKILQTRAQIEELEKALKADEETVFAALKQGTGVAHGLFTAQIEIKAGRRTTAWKEKACELIDEIRGAGEGAKWADRVIAATKPGEPTEKLVVKVAG